MNNSGLYDFIKLGGWNSSYSSHYESAWLCFYDFVNCIGLLKNEVDIPEGHIEGFIHHKTEHQINGTDTFNSPLPLGFSG